MKTMRIGGAPEESEGFRAPKPQRDPKPLAIPFWIFSFLLCARFALSAYDFSEELIRRALDYATPLPAKIRDDLRRAEALRRIALGKSEANDPAGAGAAFRSAADAVQAGRRNSETAQAPGLQDETVSASPIATTTQVQSLGDLISLFPSPLSGSRDPTGSTTQALLRVFSPGGIEPTSPSERLMAGFQGAVLGLHSGAQNDGTEYDVKLFDIAMASVWTGDLKSAAEVTATIQDGRVRSFGKRNIAVAHALLGSTDEAERLAKELPEYELPGTALAATDGIIGIVRILNGEIDTSSKDGKKKIAVIPKLFGAIGLAIGGKFDAAVDLAGKVENEEERDLAYFLIFFMATNIMYIAIS